MIVIDMDMPKNCTECSFFDFETGWCSISAGDCPIKCDIEDIKTEIEKVFCMSVVTNELRTPMEVKTEILQIIDKYIK